MQRPTVVKAKQGYHRQLKDVGVKPHAANPWSSKEVLDLATYMAQQLPSISGIERFVLLGNCSSSRCSGRLPAGEAMLEPGDWPTSGTAQARFTASNLRQIDCYVWRGMLTLYLNWQRASSTWNTQLRFGCSLLKLTFQITGLHAVFSRNNFELCICFALAPALLQYPNPLVDKHKPPGAAAQ